MPSHAEPPIPPLLWTPTPERAAAANMTRFMDYAGHRRGRPYGSYQELQAWSVSDLEDFWGAIWDYFDVGALAATPYDRVLGSHEMPGARWFPGARLNYARHMLAGHDGDAIAVYHESEARGSGQLTWAQLRELVAQIAGGLRELGVGQGDRVAAYMPNIAETLAAMLATASLGAVWSSAAPEFGAQAVIDRMAQLAPKVLLAVDGSRYAGRDHELWPRLQEVRSGLPGLECTVVLDLLHPGGGVAPERGAGTISWQELLRRGEGQPLTFADVPFEHSLWVLFSSGTTGLPKAIVHSHGGILLEQLKHSHLHVDLHPGERIAWHTTTGWMMWNFLAGCLLTGAAIVLYDGSPGHPDLNRLWQLAQDAELTHLGTSAAHLHACQKERLTPGRDLDLTRLRAVGTTGSPLGADGFQWVYEQVKRDLWLFSTSGGTDVCTGFVTGCPLLPVHAGELQCLGLGAPVQAWDEQGHPVVDEVGELVLTEPMPSMPVYLWGDADGSRYRESYLNHFPGVWRHGDWITITSRGSAVIHGRSDATINRDGVRIGTAELYRAAAAVPAVVDTLAVDLPRDGGLWLALFVVLEDGRELDDELQAQIRASIRTHCSPRHVPDAILQAPQIPRTLSGKTLEVPVKRILMGAPVDQAASQQSLADPSALDWYVQLARELS